MNSLKRELLLDGYLQGGLDDAGFAELLDLLRNGPTAVKDLVELSLVESQLIHMGQQEGLLPDAQIDQLKSETKKLPASILKKFPDHPDDTQTREAIRLYAEEKLNAFLREQECLRREQRVCSPRISFDLLHWLGELGSRVATTVMVANRIFVGFSLATAIILVFVVSYQFFAHRKVATLVKSKNAIWLEEPENNVLRAGEQVLQQGYAELLFRSGARVIVEAPSRFELISSKRMILGQGTVTSQVPPEAHGFTVASEAVEIRDLGTEFCVKVAPDGSSETAVFKGLVELTGSDGSQPEKRFLEENRKMFASGQGDLGKTQILGPNHDFLRSWNDVLYVPKVSGQMRFLRQMPPDLSTPLLESKQWIFIMPEQRNVSLLQDLTGVSTGSGLIQKADSEGTLAAGFRVDTYLLHFDPRKERGERYSLTGTVRLPRPILGVICVAEDIQASNTLLGAPGIRYSDRGVGQGLEFGEGEGGDRAVISEDRRSLSVALSISKRRNVDQIRILVESVPIP